MSQSIRDTRSTRQTPLPAGYLDWTPFAPRVRQIEVSSADRPLCRDMKAAISFGARLWEGHDESQALSSLRRAWGGDTPCGYLSGASNLTIRPLEYAVRGDHKSRRVLIIRWIDQAGRSHYTGTPAPWELDALPGVFMQEAFDLEAMR